MARVLILTTLLIGCGGGDFSSAALGSGGTGGAGGAQATGGSGSEGSVGGGGVSGKGEAGVGGVGGVGGASGSGGIAGAGFAGQGSGGSAGAGSGGEDSGDAGSTGGAGGIAGSAGATGASGTGGGASPSWPALCTDPYQRSKPECEGYPCFGSSKYCGGPVSAPQCGAFNASDGDGDPSVGCWEEGCAPCPLPQNAMFVACSGGECRFACYPAFKAEGDHCVPL